MNGIEAAAMVVTAMRLQNADRTHWRDPSPRHRRVAAWSKRNLCDDTSGYGPVCFAPSIPNAALGMHLGAALLSCAWGQ